MYGGDAEEEQKTDIVSVLSDKLGQDDQSDGCWLDNVLPVRVFSMLYGYWGASHGHICIVSGAIETACDEIGLRGKERAETVVLIRVMESEARLAINKG